MRSLIALLVLVCSANADEQQTAISIQGKGRLSVACIDGQYTLRLPAKKKTPPSAFTVTLPKEGNRVSVTVRAGTPVTLKGFRDVSVTLEGDMTVTVTMERHTIHMGLDPPTAGLFLSNQEGIYIHPNWMDALQIDKK